VKAQVFTLKSQEALRRAIARSLRAFYEDIEIEHRIYDEDSESKRIGERYLHLLKASTVGVGAFSVEVEDQYGSWDYWDSRADVERANYFLRLPHDAKEKVFPAIAIMNRMVIVPQGIGDALDVPTGFSYLLKPLDLQGVLAVDFEGRDAIQDAVMRVGAEIRAEIVSLASRQMAMNRIPTPDLEELSDLLGVHVDFMEGLQEDILSPMPQLTVGITSGPALLRRVSRVVLEIRNGAGQPAGVVGVQVRLPFNGLKEPPTRYSARLDFSGGDGRHTVELDVFPRTVPYCPMEVMFQFDETVDAVSFPVPLILEVSEPEAY
jgi:hypothetical protein